MIDSGLVGRLIEFQLLISEELRMAKLRQGSDQVDVDRLEKILANVTKQLDMARGEPSDKRKENIRKGQEFRQSSRGETEDILEKIRKVKEDAARAAEKARKSAEESEARRREAAENQRRAEAEREKTRKAEAEREETRTAEAELEKQRRAEAERKAAWAELERRRKASEEELDRQRKAAEDREKQRRNTEAELERRRRAMEERERQRKLEEELERLRRDREEQERLRKAQEEQERLRRATEERTAEQEQIKREEAEQRARQMEAEKKRREENWAHFEEKKYDWRTRRTEESNWRKNYVIFFDELGITTPTLKIYPSQDELELYMGFIQKNLSKIKKLFFQYLKQNRDYHINNDTNNEDEEYATKASILRIMNAVYDHLFKEVFLSEHVEFILRDVHDRLGSLFYL